jgi:hypothetical protein
MSITIIRPDDDTPIQRGRKRFAAYVIGRVETERKRLEKQNEKRAEAHPAPLVYGALAIAIDPETGKRHVLSEARREYPWHNSSDLTQRDADAWDLAERRAAAEGDSAVSRLSLLPLAVAQWGRRLKARLKQASTN